MTDEQSESITVGIEGFRSIEKKLEITLEPVTIIIGPPASGKSNILDALLTLGYPNRLRLLGEEYGNNLGNLEPFHQLVRLKEGLSELLPYELLDRSMRISLNTKDAGRLELLGLYEKGSPLLKLKADGKVECGSYRFNPAYLIDISVSSGVFTDVQQCLSKINDKSLLPEVRLYSFDRAGLGGTEGVGARHGIRINKLLSEREGNREYPRSILSEQAWNILRYTKKYPLSLMSS